MKAVFEFNLPDELEDYEITRQASKYQSVIWELDQFLRAINKYGDENFKHEKERIAAQKIRDKLWELINGHEVKI